MKLSHTTIYVTDQDRALRFYTEVVSPEEPDGTQLLLAKADHPVGKVYQEAL